MRWLVMPTITVALEGLDRARLGMERMGG